MYDVGIFLIMVEMIYFAVYKHTLADVRIIDIEVYIKGPVPHTTQT